MRLAGLNQAQKRRHGAAADGCQSLKDPLRVVWSLLELGEQEAESLRAARVRLDQLPGDVAAQPRVLPAEHVGIPQRLADQHPG